MSGLTITTPGDREIQVTRVFDAPRALVWKALTTPDLLEQWLGFGPPWTMPVCEMDARPGGAYRYVWRNEEDGSEMGMGGTIEEVHAPERMVCTERFDHPWYDGDALITQVLTEQAGKTTLTFTMRYDSQEIRDGVAQSGATSGMEVSYDRLAALVEKQPAGRA